MYHFSQNRDTIAAIATAAGKSAIGIIRLSGDKALDIAAKVFKGKDLLDVPSHSIHLGHLVDQHGDLIDQVLLSVFRNPESYTGEDVVEISCHGSMFVLQEVMDVLLFYGVRQAEAGEFTLRAFLNGKLDLSQAEAVADIIDSEAKAAHQTAIRHIKGDFSRRLKELRAKLIDLSALIELELDFAEEDVEFANISELHKILMEIKTEINTLATSFKLGNVIKKGVSVVIAGKPNAGKSTLLNALLMEERAITSNIPGTTRDFIEDSLTMEGVIFRFTDTAGLGSSDDLIEKEGIRKTRERIEKADVLIYLFDMEQMDATAVMDEVEKLNIKVPCLYTANKVDKIGEEDIAEKKSCFEEELSPLVFISSKYGLNIEELKSELVSLLHLDKISGDHTLVTNQRHYQILRTVLKHIGDVESALDQKLSGEIIALELRHVTSQLGEITGELTNNDVLEAIFSRFCIGK